MLKKTHVVMLPTNEKAIRSLLINPSTNRIEIPKHEHNYPSSEYQKVGYKTVYLYILSNEEIKEGDWCIMTNDYNDNYIVQVTLVKTTDSDELEVKLILNNQKNYCNINNLKKIIATTDSLLSSIPKGETHTYLYPEPSQSFIEYFVAEYNKGNIISEVMVEYEINHLYPMVENDNIKLKVNSKDNTITIHKIKNSWSRDEVSQLIHNYRLQMGIQGNCNDEDCNKWIETNL